MSDAADRGRDALIPNLLSLSRIPLGALLWVAPQAPAWTLSIVLVAGVTDVLDGWLLRRARRKRWKQDDVGAFAANAARGAFIDGLSDKIFVVSAVLLLWLMLGVPFWLVCVLATREWLFVPMLVVYKFAPDDMRERVTFTAGVPGKVATIAQFVALVLGLLRHPFFEGAAIAAGALGAFAVAFYLVRTFSRRDDAPRRPS
jgi:phosphatidylglycerophosphate synthase